MSEACAIKNYLLSKGIDESRILVEDKSTSTNENFRFSYDKIKEHFKADNDEDREPKIAFSTTNYHVFRAGMLSNSNGIKTEGIGARTVSYFWINAFIREFIATLVTERKKHALVGAVILFIDVITIGFAYVSNVMLS